MKNARRYFWGWSLVLLVPTLICAAAEPFYIYGLPHWALGGAIVQTNYGYLYVTRGETPDPENSADFGIAAALGEADAGVWGELWTSSSFQTLGSYIFGRVNGQVNGVPDSPIGSVHAETVDPYGAYLVLGEFSGIGSSTVTYEVYSANRLVGAVSGTTGGIIVYTYSETSPKINPYCKTPDGLSAAVIQFSYQVGIQLPDGSDQISGDRVIIRPDNQYAVVDFVSWVEVWAGGGEYCIQIGGERLGVFGRGHKALGDSRLLASGGHLTVGRLNTGDLSQEIGVSVPLEATRQFGLGLEPVAFENNGATMMVSAVGNADNMAGVFMGLAGVQKQGESLAAFASFGSYAGALQINLFQGGTLVGSVPVAAGITSVGLQGQPRVAALSAAADTGLVGAGMGIRFEAGTTFVLPNASTLAGDEIRFQAVNAPALSELSAVSLTCSNIASFTINAETGPQLISVVDYFPEAIVPAAAKEFFANEAPFARYTRSLARETVQGQAVVTLTDRSTTSNVVSMSFSMQEGGLFLHGYAAGEGRLFSELGIRMLPDLISVNQEYVSQGTFQWEEQSAGVNGAMQVNCRTRVAAMEPLEVSSGMYSALRVETELTCAGMDASNAPSTLRSTNWLAPGIGVVKFAESEVTQGGTTTARWGDLVDYIFFKKPAHSYAANVGANIVIPSGASAGWAHTLQWKKDGVEIGQTYEENRLSLPNLSTENAGIYSVSTMIGEMRTEISRAVAQVEVLPFYDGPSWAASIGGGWYVSARKVAVDHSGNVYVAGTFSSQLYWGNVSYTSRGAEDIFVMKVLPTGTIAWVRTAGGQYSDSVQSLQTDAQGNVFMAGTFAGTVYFGTNQLVSTVRLDPFYLTKIDPDGNFVWAVMNGGTGNASCAAMGMDGMGNLYVLGQFSSGTAVFGSTTLSNQYWSYDLFLTKLNPQGQFLWAKQVTDEGTNYGGGASMYGSTMAVDGDGNCYLSGTFGEQVTFGGTTLRPATYWNDAFLAKADANGNFLWAKAVGSSGGGLSLGTGGDIFFSGTFYQMLRLDGAPLVSRSLYSGEAYIMKLSPEGVVRWAQVAQRYPAYDWAPITCDSANNLYAGSTFYNQAIYSGTVFQKPNYACAMLTKMDSAGHVLWDKQITGNNDSWVGALARDGAGNIYLAGDFRGSDLQFGTDSLSSTNYNNVFVTKIPEATPPTITQQPAAQSVPPGDVVSFGVSATGSAPLQYQWRKNGQNIPGAINSSYTIQNVGWSDAGAYSVVVKNSGGMVTSLDAALQVIVAEHGTITFAETNYTVGEADGVVSVTVLRTGDTTGTATVDVVAGDGTAIAGRDFWGTSVSLAFGQGETSKTVSVGIIDDTAWEPTEYFFLRLSRAGAGTAVGQPGTTVVTITDNDTLGAPVIRVQPMSYTVLVGNAVTLSVLADGAPPLSYQWHKDGADIPDATGHFLTIAAAKLTDAGSYSVTVRNEQGEVTSGEAALRVNVPPDIHYVMFGLTNRPIGAVRISTNNGALEIRPRSPSYSQEYGVSVTLGEADAGLFGYLSTGSSFQNYGNFTKGKVYGQVNGVPDQLLCSLKATTVDSYGGYEIEADFSPLQPAAVTYQIYNQGEVVKSGQATGPIVMWDYSEGAPVANPFSRLADGTIAAVIQFSGSRSLTLPDESWVCGERIVIRAERPSAVVEFASRVDVTGGGGEGLVCLVQERLGMFRHSHLALGDSVLKAKSGALTIASRDPALPPGEIGVSAALEDMHQVRLEVQPQELSGEGAMLRASTVGKGAGLNGEFMGTITLQNIAGALQLNAAFPISAEQMQIVVYRGSSPVGSDTVPSGSADVQISGAPRVLHFEAAGDNGLAPPWFGVQLDRQTSFVLPGGMSLDGDQIRLRCTSRSAIKFVSAFSVTASNLPEFTITAEDGRETTSLAEFIPELLAPNFIKKFSGAADGVAMDFIRTPSRTNQAGSKGVVLADQVGGTNFSSGIFSVREDGVRWHGAKSGGMNLVSGTGLFQLPDEITFGESYLGQGNVDWQDVTSGAQATLEVVSVSKANSELLNLFDAATAAIRIETVLTFSDSDLGQAPAQWNLTNWVAPGLGVVKFAEATRDRSGQVHRRWGNLTDGAILKTAPRPCVANVGAGIALEVELATVGHGALAGWQKNGVGIPSTIWRQRLGLAPVKTSDEGRYGVVLAIMNSDQIEAWTASEVFTLQVIPFSDTPPFWAAQMGASQGLDPSAMTVDGSGNTYVAGYYRGNLIAGTNWLSSLGNEDVYLAKFNTSGKLVWVRKGGGTFSDTVQGVGVDDSGNVYIGGTFAGTATFGTNQVVSPPPPRIDPVFVTKVDPNGNFLWAIGNGGTCNANCSSLQVDPAGNSYVYGMFYNGTLTFGSFSLTNWTFNANLFVAKLNAQGECLWLEQGTGGVSPSKAALGSDGAFYIAGSFAETLTIGNVSLQTPPGARNGFLVKIGTDGMALWGKAFGNEIYEPVVDGSGNVLVTGDFYNSTVIGNTELYNRTVYSDVFLCKMSGDGMVLWAKLAPVRFDYYSYGFSSDTANNIYLAGYLGQGIYNGTLFLQPSGCATMLCKMDSQGQVIWYKEIAGNNWPRSMTKDASGNVYLGGAFFDTVRCGESNLVASSVYNSYIVKITGATGPMITQQPAGVEVALGQSISLSVWASGSEPIFYQWRKDDRDILGANSANYMVTAATVDDEGSYSVVVKNGGGVVVSSYADVRVTTPSAGIVVLGAPEYTITETNGSVWIDVLRSGDTTLPATVELQTAEDSATAGSDYLQTVVVVSFAPSETLKRVSIPILDDNEWETTETFSVRLCNAGPGVSLDEPTVALVRILDNDLAGVPLIRVQPLSQTVLEGSAVTLYVAVSSATPVTFQWLKGGVPMPNATDRFLSIAVAAPGDAGVYSVLVRNQVAEVPSLEAVLTVIAAPVIVSQPQNQTVPCGEAAVFSIVAQKAAAAGAMLAEAAGESSDQTFTYQWYKDGTQIEDATAATYRIERVNMWDAGSYSVRVTDPAGFVITATAALNVSGPLLRVVPVAGGQLQFTWTAADFRLQVTDDPVHGTWQDVPNGNSGVTLPASGTPRFYRLIYD